jgi:hypothetical protein
MLGASNLDGMLGVQRLQERVGTTAEVVAMPSLSGGWGLEFVTLDDEAKRMTQVYREKVHATFQIGFWVAPKQQRSRWEGMLPPSVPAWDTYHRGAVPVSILVYVVDGGGHLRRIHIWRGRDSEKELADFVKTLSTVAPVAAH